MCVVQVLTSSPVFSFVNGMSLNDKKRLGQLEAMFGECPLAKQQKSSFKKISEEEFELKDEPDALDRKADKRSRQ